MRADNPPDIASLVEPQRVHRDLYLSERLFALEQERLFARTWLYVGHASQVPETGDYWTLTLAGRPVMMVRQADGGIGVFYNRCAHKGARLAMEESGNTGRAFRCPYHAWTYRLDGTPISVPVKGGYEGTSLRDCESGRGLVPLAGVAVHRDFVFARIAAEGPGFQDYFGDMLGLLDSLADRSPTGRLTVAGGVLRNIIHCNWKMYLENINDTVHPMSTHESATAAAEDLWAGQPADAAKPMAMEQILPFGAGYDFYERMGGRILPNGHSVLGIHFSLHSHYAQLGDYEQAMVAAHGEARATEVLSRTPQNALLWPSLSVKGSPQVIRVIRPLAADRTLVEAWAFKAEGAPELLLERSLNYNRLVFSPMSVVAHDDVALFESMQQGLAGEGNDWVSLHRGWRADEPTAGTHDVGGTNELLMRNQFRAWARYMGEAAP